jgi:hypothetical protein
MIDRLAELPVLVYDAGWDLVAMNDLGAALVGDVTDYVGRDRNLAWRQFNGDHIAELGASSPRFEAMWRERPVAARGSDRKTVVHPELGPITVDCDILKVQGADLGLIVYSAAPDTPDAEALAQLAEVVLGGVPG